MVAHRGSCRTAGRPRDEPEPRSYAGSTGRYCEPRSQTRNYQQDGGKGFLPGLIAGVSARNSDDR
jgi:hypothetical protein